MQDLTKDVEIEVDTGIIEWQIHSISTAADENNGDSCGCGCGCGCA